MTSARTTSRRVRLVVGLLLVIAAIEYGVLPQLVEAASQVSLFEEMSPILLGVALLLEATSLCAYTCLTQRLLRPVPTLPFGVQLRIDLTGYGLSHVVPGGGATAAAARYRLMAARGIPSESAFALAAVETALAIAGLVLVWLLGSAASLPRTGLTTTFLILTAAALLVTLVLSRFQSASGQPRGGAAMARLMRTVPESLRIGTSSVLRRGRESLRDTDALRGGLFWSMTNWLLDATCLWVCLLAYGAAPPPELVLLTYGVACTAGMLPVTPGGLGVIEGLMVPGLVASGAPAGAALLGVLTWRLLQYWLPIPLAGVCWLSLGGRVPRRHGRQHPATVEHAASNIPTTRDL